MTPARQWAAFGLVVAVMTSTGCRRASSTLEVMLVGVTPGDFLLIPEGASVWFEPGNMKSFREVRIAGSTSVECQLTVLMLTRAGEIRRLLPAGDPELGDLVGPGLFRLPGGMDLSDVRSRLRVFAVCGGSELRFSKVAGDLRSAFVLAGGDDAALREVTRVPGLPDGVAQTSTLYRTGP